MRCLSFGDCLCRLMLNCIIAYSCKALQLEAVESSRSSRSSKARQFSAARQKAIDNSRADVLA